MSVNFSIHKFILLFDIYYIVEKIYKYILMVYVWKSDI